MNRGTVKISKKKSDTGKIAKIYLTQILKSKKKESGAIVVGLSGNLGAGKTAFVQAAGRHLGVKNRINSPTFVIMKKYSLSPKWKHKFLFHLDAYRLKNEKELLHLGWEEIIGDKENLVFIEWPENVSKAMPKHSKFIYIEHDEKKGRNFILK
ncbi:MAG: tRNA (adenosine(37)-N6)-threonylcarbamoyltransferase complex ATPase subunit type 1 TsaE [Minisyncoccia bacterium]